LPFCVEEIVTFLPALQGFCRSLQSFGTRCLLIVGLDSGAVDQGIEITCFTPFHGKPPQLRQPKAAYHDKNKKGPASQS
jgi:hypothetical protein